MVVTFRRQRADSGRDLRPARRAVRAAVESSRRRHTNWTRTALNGQPTAPRSGLVGDVRELDGGRRPTGGVAEELDEKRRVMFRGLGTGSSPRTAFEFHVSFQ